MAITKKYSYADSEQELPVSPGADKARDWSSPSYNKWGRPAQFDRNGEMHVPKAGTHTEAKAKSSSKPGRW